MTAAPASTGAAKMNKARRRPEAMKKHFLVLAILCATVAMADRPSVPVGRFSAGDLQGWESKSFAGKTEYTLVETNGRRALRAVSRATASGIYREIAVDLKRTPFLNWSWKVNNVLEGVNERSKSGDDYPARVYVVVSGGVFFWKTRSLNYVWSSTQPVDSSWPNAYTGNVWMLAVESGSAKAGQWVSEKRNIREDFERLFGKEIDRIDAVAIMTDTDNSGQAATAWYGDIFFTAD